ncbi:unnamed protein product [Pylaiella littoralis]
MHCISLIVAIDQMCSNAARVGICCCLPLSHVPDAKSNICRPRTMREGYRTMPVGVLLDMCGEDVCVSRWCWFQFFSRLFLAGGTKSGIFFVGIAFFRPIIGLPS